MRSACYKAERRVLLLLLGTASCLFPSLSDLTPTNDAATDATTDSADAATTDSADASSTSYVIEVWADSPASWWRLGELATSAVAKDETDAQPGAYRVPGVVLGQPGALAGDSNGSAQLDGTNGAMFLSGSAYDFGGSPPFAVEVWVAPDPAPDATDVVRRIVSHRTASPTGTGWALVIDGGQHVMFERLVNDAVVGSATSTTALANGKFAHVVVSCDGATMSLYVNGALDGTGAAATVPTQTAPALVWGASSAFGQEFLAGKLDEPAIYTHALPADRVLAHYKAGTQ